MGHFLPDEHTGQRAGQDPGVEHDPVRLFALHERADAFRRVLRRHVLDKQRIALFVQPAFHAVDDLKQVRILKCHAAGQIGGEQHGAVPLPGKAAGPGVGLIVHLPGQCLNPFPGLVGNGVAVVQRLGDGGDGNMGFPRQIVNGDGHGVPFWFAGKRGRGRQGFAVWKTT